MFKIPTAFYAKTAVIYSTKEFFQHRRFHNVASSKAGEKKKNLRENFTKDRHQCNFGHHVRPSKQHI